MLAGMGIAAAACVGLALLPTLVLPTIGAVAGATVGSTDPLQIDGMTIRLVGVAGSLSPLMLTIALVIGLAATLAGVRALATRRAARAARLWDCGAGPLSARMEYTATSFAEPLQRVFDDVLQAEQDVDVTHARGVQLPGADDRVPAAGARPDRTPAVRAGPGGDGGVGPGRSRAGAGQRAPLPRLRLLRAVRAADPAGGDPVTALGAVGVVLQLLIVVALSPLLTGMMRQLRARMEGRAGAGIGQPWRDLRKLMRKRPVAPHGTTEVFRTAPLVLVATCLVVAAVGAVRHHRVRCWTRWPTCSRWSPC